MTRKNPVAAAILGLVFGPFGFLYIGWRFAVMGVMVWALFLLVLTLARWPFPVAMQWVVFAVMAWKAFTICSARNHMVENGDEDVAWLNTFTAATMAMTDLLVGIAMGYAIALGLFGGIRLIAHGRWVLGLVILFLGTPILVYAANLVFGLIAMGIDAIALRGRANMFRSAR